MVAAPLNRETSGLNCRYRTAILVAAALLLSLNARSQANLPIYTDNLVNGFQDWSWGTRNLSNPSPVNSGSYSISHNGGAWNALSFEHPDFNGTVYTNLSFWANGGAGGGQILQVFVQFGPNTGPAHTLSALPANNWQHYVIPLSTLGVAAATNINRLNIQLTASAGTTTFYVDDVQLTAKPAPALVHLSLNATQAVRSADSRWFGVNTAVWDGNFDTPTTVSLLNELGARILRFPGGSLSDEYHWASNKSLNNTWTWQTSFANFVHVATNIGAQAFITVNYGTGTSNEAAGWVRSANVTNHYGFKYWEIGNECYGSWETDSNAYAHDPYTYAVRAAGYAQLMRAADPTIKVGVVVTTGEGSYSNVYSANHPAVNPRTGQTNYGWTPILLTTLKNLGFTPDFAVHHVYPEYTGQESDPLLLQASVSWAQDAADLRQQISDYFGPGGTNIELVSDENNSNAGSQGRQSTSLVNGLYYADSLSQLMKTEFNSFVWWDLRNGTDTSGSFDPTLYGWRTNGDLGMIGNLATHYPPFYAAKLMSWFASPGDSILSASSDYLPLAAYAARRASGAVSLLVLNKDTITNFNAQVAINGFVPYASATIRSYGKPQDDAARTNGPAQAQDILETAFLGAATNFTYSFPPLSLTLFSLAPAAPSLVALPLLSQSAAKFVFQLQGQPSVRYVVQSSSNLVSWVPVATNTLTTASLMLTNSLSPNSLPAFWRALWQQ